MVDYNFFVEGGHVTEYAEVLRAVSELAIAFACVGYLMPIAGVNMAHTNRSESPDAANSV